MSALARRLAERLLSCRAFWAFLGGLVLGLALAAPGQEPEEPAGPPTSSGQVTHSEEAWLAKLEQALEGE